MQLILSLTIHFVFCCLSLVLLLLSCLSSPSCLMFAVVHLKRIEKTTCLIFYNILEATFTLSFFHFYTVLCVWSPLNRWCHSCNSALISLTWLRLHRLDRSSSGARHHLQQQQLHNFLFDIRSIESAITCVLISFPASSDGSYQWARGRGLRPEAALVRLSLKCQETLDVIWQQQEEAQLSWRSMLIGPNTRMRRKYHKICPRLKTQEADCLAGTVFVGGHGEAPTLRLWLITPLAQRSKVKHMGGGGAGSLCSDLWPMMIWLILLHSEVLLLVCCLPLLQIKQIINKNN